MSVEATRVSDSKRIDLLDVVPSFESDQLRLRMIGEADMRDRGPLTDLLLHFHKLALEKLVKRVVIDVRELAYMSSTAMGAFVTWATTLKTLPRAKVYALEFQGAAKHRWQRGSLNALASFDPDCISVTIEP